MPGDANRTIGPGLSAKLRSKGLMWRKSNMFLVHGDEADRGACRSSASVGARATKAAAAYRLTKVFLIFSLVQLMNSL